MAVKLMNYSALSSLRNSCWLLQKCFNLDTQRVEFYDPQPANMTRELSEERFDFRPCWFVLVVQVLQFCERFTYTPESFVQAARRQHAKKYTQLPAMTVERHQGDNPQRHSKRVGNKLQESR